MEQEKTPINPEQTPAPPAFNNQTIEDLGVETPQTSSPDPRPYHGLKWIFVGEDGLRAGWSIAIFVAIAFILAGAISFVMQRVYPGGMKMELAPKSTLIGEFIQLVVLLVCASIVALIERRRRNFLEYNLIGPNRTRHFLTGLVTGVLALSALVGALALGGWLHFGAAALSGAAILKYAAAWGAAFFLVGCVEEGSMRCFLLATLTRGLNFWWALGIIAVICADLAARAKGNGVWGVYLMALLGLAPCLMLHLRRAPSAGFWQAAWVTSTVFGFGHTSNNGENWIGIFLAAFIGFVFCVSVKLTGSAWWAIGCHAGWDWSETYFYGTADSGFVAHGHFLTTTTSGNPLWSGGADGPEGSVLAFFVCLLLLAVLLVFYGRRRPEPIEVSAAEQLAGS